MVAAEDLSPEGEIARSRSKKLLNRNLFVKEGKKLIGFFRDVLLDLFLRIYCSVPYPVTHNLEKVANLRKAFWHVATEGLEGDYFEFGVAFGNSLSAARMASKGAKARFLGVRPVARKFYGFDTFDSFVSSDSDDAHHTWVGSKFSFSEEKVARRFRSFREIMLFKVDAQILGSDSPEVREIENVIGDSKVAVALLDMDLKAPTKAALTWLLPRLQPGALVIFDEIFAFSGRENLGESGALHDFLSETNGLRLREFSAYGDGGRVYQVVEVPSGADRHVSNPLRAPDRRAPQRRQETKGNGTSAI